MPVGVLRVVVATELPGAATEGERAGRAGDAHLPAGDAPFSSRVVHAHRDQVRSPRKDRARRHGVAPRLVPRGLRRIDRAEPADLRPVEVGLVGIVDRAELEGELRALPLRRDDQERAVPRGAVEVRQVGPRNRRPRGGGGNEIPLFLRRGGEGASQEREGREEKADR